MFGIFKIAAAYGLSRAPVTANAAGNWGKGREIADVPNAAWSERIQARFVDFAHVAGVVISLSGIVEPGQFEIQ